MINFYEFRFWTSFLVIGVCLFAISLAVPTLRYGLAGLSVDANSAHARLTPLTDDPVVGAFVRGDLAMIAPATNAISQIDNLVSLVADTPMAGGAWLDLAIARLHAGAEMEQVSKALALSTLTAPNEGRLMAGRASFAIPEWSRLPPDIQRTLIADLVGGWDEMDGVQRTDLDAELTVASALTRQQVRAALLLAGKAGSPIADALGLDSAPPSESAPSVGEQENTQVR